MTPLMTDISSVAEYAVIDVLPKGQNEAVWEASHLPRTCQSSGVVFVKHRSNPHTKDEELSTTITWINTLFRHDSGLYPLSCVSMLVHKFV